MVLLSSRYIHYSFFCKKKKIASHMATSVLVHVVCSQAAGCVAFCHFRNQLTSIPTKNIPTSARSHIPATYLDVSVPSTLSLSPSLPPPLFLCRFIATILGITSRVLSLDKLPFRISIWIYSYLYKMPKATSIL